jgi:hypothetical protein
MRKQFFNDEEKGYFKTEKRDSAPPNPISGEFLVVFGSLSLSEMAVICTLLGATTSCNVHIYDGVTLIEVALLLT